MSFSLENVPHVHYDHLEPFFLFFSNSSTVHTRTSFLKYTYSSDLTLNHKDRLIHTHLRMGRTICPHPHTFISIGAAWWHFVPPEEPRPMLVYVYTAKFIFSSTMITIDRLAVEDMFFIST
jgi:hypothetical protein